MKRCLLILAMVALAVLPTSAFATFSAIQDSCRADAAANTVTTYVSIVNFNSPVPVCDVHFIAENPVPGCIILGCGTPAGWSCALNGATAGVDFQALTAANCVQTDQRIGGFSFVLDPDFCCYIVQFTGPNHEILAEQEECFDCFKVGVENQTWGNMKKIYR